MTFRTRTFLVLLGLVALVESATFVAVLNAARDNYVEQGGRELALSGIVFDNAVAGRNRELSVAVGVLAGDFGFRRAAASGDRPTVRSALYNHGERVNAEVTMLIDRDRHLVAISRSIAGLDEGAQFAFTALLGDNRGFEKPRETVVALGDTAMQLVVAPVLAPDLRGWVAFGFAVDDSFARRISALTNVDVTFIDRTAGDGRVLASTLERGQRDGVGARNGDAYGVPLQRRIGAAELLLLRRELDTGGVDVLLTTPMADVLEAYGPLRMRLTGILVVALLLSALAAGLLSRTVSRPLASLAAAARRISRGNYDERVQVRSGDVIGRLAQTFNEMQDGIRRREDQIVHQARHDALTGLPNRAAIVDRLDLAIRFARRRNESFAVLMLDLDGFKDINDTLGHETGDEVLVEVSRRLQEIGRECDTVARLGGDEFLILLADTDEDGARRVARRLVERVEESIVLPSMQIRTRVSAGIACFPAHGRTASELQRRADIAMYSAKEAEGNVDVYRPGQDEDYLRRLELVNDLRLALERDELELYYQPKLDMHSGRISAVEALVRWTHPQLGSISPEEFVPLAEQSGHIRALTQCVLKKALSQLSSWRRNGIDIRVSINLSALDLIDERLPDLLAAQLAAHGLEGSALTLEITESAVMKDAAYARGVMQRLRDQGIRLSIDDFGTGHASLAQLKRLPVDELKIDKSFVLDLCASEDDATIVRSTIELGHNMGLTVTAEGVETAQIREQLERFDCDEIQGYLLSRPLPQEQFGDWFRKHANDGLAEDRAGGTNDEEATDDVALRPV